VNADVDAWRGPAAPETVGRMRQAVVGFAADAGFLGVALDDVRSCVSEGVTNAVVHAFCDDREPGTVQVYAEVRGDELIVKVVDDGIGFRRRADSPGLGLGLPTIVALTASTSVAAAPGGGTELCMAFVRPPVS
jgi:serine/threonine-protein kinase RsbW/stage II sporulation protein AB (anti-sigma F factor)